MKTISFGGGTAAAKALAAKSASTMKKGLKGGSSLLGDIKPKAQLKTDTLSLSKPASKTAAKGLHGKNAQVKPR